MNYRPLAAAALILLPAALSCQAGRVDQAGGGDRDTDGTVTAFDGVEIAYSARGDGEPALVFVHGWAGRGDLWSDQVAAFKDRHRVITVDLPGHGKSGSARTSWSLESFGRDVQTVVDALGLERVVLVGHSMGGPVVLEAARLLPGMVAGIVAVDTLHDVDAKPDPERYAQWIAGYRSDFAGTCDRFIRAIFGKQAEPSLVDRTTHEMCSIRPEIGIALLEAFPRIDQAAAMAAAGVPIRGIQSATYSAAYPDGLTHNRRHSPTFNAVQMDGVGHFPFLERPESFNRLLAEALASIDAEQSAIGG